MNMTEVQRVQYERFTAAGFCAEDAARLVALGAWLGIQDSSEQTVLDIDHYRKERDTRSGGTERVNAPPDTR